MNQVGYEVLRNQVSLKTSLTKGVYIEVAQYTVIGVAKDLGFQDGGDMYAITDRQIIWSTNPSRIESKPRPQIGWRYDVFFDKAEIKKRVWEATQVILSDLEEANGEIQKCYEQISRSTVDGSLELITKETYISPITGEET